MLNRTRFPLYVLLCLAALLCACHHDKEKDDWYGDLSGRHVLLMYEDGFNNLPSCMKLNVSDAEQFAPLEKEQKSRMLLVYTHYAATYRYDAPTPSHLMNIYRKADGTVVHDTLVTYPADCISADAAMLRRVLEDVKRLAPATSYGLSFSSHGTGWLPEEYYDHPEETRSGQPLQQSAGKPYRMHRLLSEPLTKSVGCHAYYDEFLRTKEIEIADFAAALPMHLDYLIFDACFMGCVEVFWELKDKVDYIVASPTEILTAGLPYDMYCKRLLQKRVPDLKGLCADYIQSTTSATISLVDCRRMDALQGVCADLFSRFRTQIAGLDRSSVQAFFRADDAWFYDLEDILCRAGLSAVDRKMLSAALGECVLYAAATPKFLQLDIKRSCGLSMYLPIPSSTRLNAFYKELSWNKATGLIE